MKLAIFDLDNTLLGGDSDYLWGCFLVEQGIVDAQEYKRKNQLFYEQYQQGCLDINEFLAFQLKPLSEHSVGQLAEYHAQFMEEKIAPIMLPAAEKLLDEHRRQQHQLMIITATNRFVTGPIAKKLGVDELLATEPEMKAGQYTGQVADIPCFQEGKIKRLDCWLQQKKVSVTESWFYSDSHNDLPLLERVDYPAAVDPDETLLKHAQQQGWPIMSLR